VVLRPLKGWPLTRCGRVWPLASSVWVGSSSFPTVKKENHILLLHQEIQNGAVAKSYMRKGFLIYKEMRNI
jgi:hypothetical protein